MPLFRWQPVGSSAPVTAAAGVRVCWINPSTSLFVKLEIVNVYVIPLPPLITDVACI